MAAVIVDMARLPMMSLVSTLDGGTEGARPLEPVLPDLATRSSDAGLPLDVWVCMVLGTHDRCVLAMNWGRTPEAAWEATIRLLDAKQRFEAVENGIDLSADRRPATRSSRA